MNRLSATQADLREKLDHAEQRSLKNTLTQTWKRAGIELILETKLARAAPGSV